MGVEGSGGGFFQCACRLEKNFFVRGADEHFEYTGDDALFSSRYDAFIKSRGPGAHVPPVEVVLADIKSQLEERRGAAEEAHKRAEAIKAGYVRLHPEVYRLDKQRFFHPSFVELVDTMAKCPEKPRSIEECIEGLMTRGVLKAFKKDIWTFPVFTEEFCNLLEAELANFQKSGLPVARPNTMNRFGILLRELGMCKDFLDPFIVECVNPIAVRLLAAHTETLDSYRPFTVLYENAEGGDRSLSLHYDNAEVTLNVNIGGQWDGGQVTFLGLVRGPEEPPVSVTLQRGHGLLHSGRELHQSEPLLEGRRHNMILWCRSSGVRNGECPMCWNVPKLLPTNEYAHDGFTDT